MILTCTECHSRYEIEDALLQPAGKTVKCSDCGHSWLQDAPDITSDDQYDDDQSSSAVGADLSEAGGESEQADRVSSDQASQDSLQDATEAVLNDDSEEAMGPPIDDDDIQIAARIDDDDLEDIDTPAAMRSYALVAAIFALSFLVVLNMESSITKAFPGAQSFYALFGHDYMAPGEGLVFHERRTIAQAKQAEHGEDIVLQGNIINTLARKAKVPMLEATMLGEGDREIGKAHIIPPQNTLGANEIMDFNATIKADGELPTKVKIEFKVDRKDSADDPVHEADTKHEDEDHHSPAAANDH